MEILITVLLSLAYKIVEFIINYISLVFTSASEAAKSHQRESNLKLQKCENEMLPKCISDSELLDQIDTQ